MMRKRCVRAGHDIPPLHNAEVLAKIEEKLGTNHQMQVPTTPFLS